ncbi:MAG: hypothetical protein PHV65_07210, partial [Bacteroidales bacterium]|nr:hypothetical protein [Bacteroidales bacterium]
EFIINHLDRYRPSTFLNIDPPYVKKGYQLYTNYFSELDHRKLAITITKHLKSIPWIVTYDNSDLIREIYSDYYMQDYSIYHNAGSYVKGTEIVVTNIERENFVW